MAEVTHNEIVEHTEDHAHEDHGHHSNTVVIRGREITVEGGIYTVIFVGLAVLTLIEVLIAETFKGMIAGTPDPGLLTAIKAFLLLSIGIFKSTLVILFYMHLKDDNRILAIVILVPLLIAALSVMFVLSIPPTGYGI